MKALLYIFFGASLTVLAATALGTLLLRALSVKLYRLEERMLGFIVGSACLSGLMFVLCALHLVHKGVLLLLAAGILALAARSSVHRPAADRLPPIPSRWKWIFGLTFVAFTILYFFNALAPETSPDGTAYHLPFVADYYRAHGFMRITTNMYANISQGIELLFLFAYTFGHYSAATLIHFSFLAALPWLVLCYGRRFGLTAPGVSAAAFVYASPVIGIAGSSAYVDVALAAVVFALFYFLQLWAESYDWHLLVPIGILAGFGFAIKYTGILAVPYAVGFVVWKSWRRSSAGIRPLFKPALAVLGLALLSILPWTIKNWMWIGNPVSPFANRLFPNPYVHVSFEEDYRRYQVHYEGITSVKQIPLEVTIRGGFLGGLLGPVFLLTPLALLALRNQQGRRILFAAGVFSLPFLTNIGTRFLIPAAPFWALAISIALMRFPLALMVLASVNSVASWPKFADLYCVRYAWRLHKIPVKAALRIEPEDAYLNHNLSQYAMDRLVEKRVPPDGKIFSMSQVAEAYTSRQFLVKFLAAENEVLGDMLLSAIYTDFQPKRKFVFQFPETDATKVRVVQTAKTVNAIWSISELRVFDAGRELPRAPQWRLTARPNPWDVQLAFDNDPITRWRSWQSAEPGMYVEIDFGGPQKVDSVTVQTPPDFFDPQIRLEAMDSGGKWNTIGGTPEDTMEHIKVGLRRAATMELKARGVRYLLIGYDDLGSADFYQHAAVWGIRLLGDAGYCRLYYIE